jgi:hypothetical protein
MGFILKDYIQPLVIIFGAVFALYQYNRQQKFKRLQNLSSLWKGFNSDSELLALFTLMNEIESGNSSLANKLKETPAQSKLKYLALIEEVALYIDAFEVDKDFARYLFQWHFFFAYQSKLTASLFWENIGGAAEMNESYWEKSRRLSGQIKPDAS